MMANRGSVRPSELHGRSYSRAVRVRWRGVAIWLCVLGVWMITFARGLERSGGLIVVGIASFALLADHILRSER